MDIAGIGEKQAQLFVERGLVKDVADLYTLAAASFEGMEGFGEKKISNLLSAIEASKQRPLARLITGLGIRFVGEVAAQALAAFGSLDALASASIDQIRAIDGIGPAVAASVTQFFSLPANQALVQKLKDVGVQTTGGPTGIERAGDGLSGLAFVITGSLPTLTREQAEALIKSHGGKVAGNVTKKTSYLLAGTEPGGTKYSKAQELKIPILDQAGLLALIGSSAEPAGTTPEPEQNTAKNSGDPSQSLLDI
jgi:DNA ligase (NAD+)